MNTRILIYGAGAIGSIFAGKLKKYGNDVTILARRNRYKEIIDNGLVLRNALTDKVEVQNVRCIKELNEDDIYEYIIVVVQNNQVDNILPILAKNKSSNIVFVVNNPLGYSKYITAIGKERVMIGFPSAGGERKEGLVSYFIGTGLARIMQTTTFGEIDGTVTLRLKRLIEIFRIAKFDPTISKNIDAWQKTHVAFVIPIANALIRFGSDNKKLSKSRATIKQMIYATREGFAALEKQNIKIEPCKLNFYYLPVWLLSTIFQLFFMTKIAEYSMAKHTIVAKKEIQILEHQFKQLCNNCSLEYWEKMHLTTVST